MIEIGMDMKRRTLLTAASVVATSGLARPFLARAAVGISDDVVKLGVLTDLSGMYSDGTGPGSVLAAQLAAGEFNNTVAGKPVQVIQGDHLNKPDVGGAIARRWFDTEQVDVILDVPVSSIALEVQQLAHERNRIFLNSAAGATVLTGKACSPTAAQWTYDTYALAHAAGSAVLKRGGDTWFFIAADYLFGASLVADASDVVTKSGGKVLGSVKHPMGTSDFSSYLLQAQASGAKVIAFANSGDDVRAAIKQSGEFGLGKDGQQIVGLNAAITDIHALGLPAAQGLLVAEGFYWDRDDRTRAFASRFMAKQKRPPTMMQAGVYSAALNYLKAVQSLGTDDAMAVMAQLRTMDIEDAFARNGRLRVDGLMVHDMALMQVKAPEQSKGEWDVYDVVSSIPGSDAFPPLNPDCPLVPLVR
jgi:branched-chain amino acid transport system substrate-binding protein